MPFHDMGHAFGSKAVSLFLGDRQSFPDLRLLPISVADLDTQLGVSFVHPQPDVPPAASLNIHAGMDGIFQGIPTFTV